ncbi:MAG TPA: D-alanine--D-alanine ligase family protein [Bryobacteraceae bacterium]|nr:D-alanine--D-alanine ligase family protein [Bryobacteraceae bacterium]
MSRLRVAVICGGRSGEHEISLRSAESVIAAMDSDRYEVRRILITKEGRWQPGPILPEPGANPGIDVVFPVLHGTFGEDGTIQGLLELAALPYVGAGVLASSVSMDKEVMKRLCMERGLPVTEYLVARRGQFRREDICGRMPYPLFVKPANLGSSVGISKVKACEDLSAALEIAAQYDRKILVERAIEGREFECSVMGNDEPMAAVPCEILPSREFYDYEDKYLLNQAQTVLPADLTEEQMREMRRLAVACYQAVECEGMARVDFLRETATGNLYINEINTVPGFTSISMFPKMWEAAGIPYPKLIDRLIELALERHRERQATRYER